MKITLAQLNPTVGDISGNLAQLEAVLKNEAQNSDLVVFPELFLCGYPPRDLLERTGFIRELKKAEKQIVDISKQYPNAGILFGVPISTANKHGKGFYNSALLIQDGKVIFQANKSLLPTYDVFDEYRHFDPAEEIQVLPFKNEILGISICEDAWNDPEMWFRPIYTINPISILAQKGATIFINISASPFHLGKDTIRYRLIKNYITKHKKPFIFLNQIGGNDDLIFDGTSFALDLNGDLIKQFPSFEPHIETIDTRKSSLQRLKPLDKITSLHDALVLGLKDYVTKCGFNSVLVGLSGGIDSAVTCALAVAALGENRVFGVTMPSDYSSIGSIEDSEKLAKNLGIQFKTIPIKNVYQSYLNELNTHFAGKESDITEENIQARIRGNYLMALSNKFGHLVLSTGNKSESAMGYCTLYGDMSGGLSVISDVPKTMVYQLADYINREKEIIPEATITKAPSAELRPDQKDQDSLPPYDILDSILDLYLRDGFTATEIVKKGFEKETVYTIIQTVDRNEYKRRQSAPVLKVTSKAFGSGRRIPIAAKFDQSWG